MTPRKTHWARAISALAIAATVAMGAQNALAVPVTIATQGTLRGGGGAVADGVYKMTFSLYAGEKDKAAVWSEGPVPVGVKSGVFDHPLGSIKPLDGAVMAKLNKGWIGVRIDKDTELPRQKLHSVAFAMVAASATKLACSGCVTGAQLGSTAVAAKHVGFTYAGATTKGGPATKALDLACTGCVSVKEMAFDGDVDLKGKALKAGKITADTIVAKQVAAGAFVGDGSKLTGIQTISGSCAKAGHVVRGINKDGSLNCVAAMDPKALPKDGLDEISNGQLSTEFVDIDKSAAPVPIQDNSPPGVTSTITVPDRGVAKNVSVTVDVSNSTFKNFRLVLTDPAGKAHTLFSSGTVKGGTLKATYPAPTKPVSGDLTAWIGKNPKGKWVLKAIDQHYKDNKKDGAINSWQIDVLTLSSKKVQAPGKMVVGERLYGAIQFKLAEKAPVKCTKENAAFTYFQPSTKLLFICNGEDFFPLAITTVGTQANPGGSCKSILQLHPAAKSGSYWIDPDGVGPIKSWKTFCDMDSDGGGWTMFMRHSDPNGRTQITKTAWDTGITRAAQGKIKQWMVKTFGNPSHTSESSSATRNRWVMTLNTNVQDAKFVHFKHQPISACNKHRYVGTAYVANTKLLPGSNCKSLNNSNGRYLWGEHRWCGRNALGWMWHSHCASPSGHLLIVNHDYNYPTRYQTMIGDTHSGGKWTSYDEDGGTFEFFYR